MQKALRFVPKHGLLREWPCSLQKQPSHGPGRIWNCCRAAFPEGLSCPWLMSVRAVYLDPLKWGQFGELSQRECHFSPWSGARTQGWTFLKISHSCLDTMLLSPQRPGTQCQADFCGGPHMEARDWLGREKALWTPFWPGCMQWR